MKIRVTFKDPEGRVETREVELPYDGSDAELLPPFPCSEIVGIEPGLLRPPSRADNIGPGGCYPYEAVAAVRDKNCVGFGGDDPLTAIDKAFRVRAEETMKMHGARENEAWKHAACLSIAEGVPGWREVAEGTAASPASPAMRAVGKLREERDRLRYDRDDLDTQHKRLYEENAKLRAFIAAVSQLPCVHGRKREDGPCPGYERTFSGVVTPFMSCPPCAARRLMASEERRGTATVASVDGDGSSTVTLTDPAGAVTFDHHPRPLLMGDSGKKPR